MPLKNLAIVNQIETAIQSADVQDNEEYNHSYAVRFRRPAVSVSDGHQTPVTKHSKTYRTPVRAAVSVPGPSIASCVPATGRAADTRADGGCDRVRQPPGKADTIRPRRCRGDDGRTACEMISTNEMEHPLVVTLLASLWEGGSWQWRQHVQTVLAAKWDHVLSIVKTFTVTARKF